MEENSIHSSSLHHYLNTGSKSNAGGFADGNASNVYIGSNAGGFADSSANNVIIGGLVNLNKTPPLANPEEKE